MKLGRFLQDPKMGSPSADRRHQQSSDLKLRKLHPLVMTHVLLVKPWPIEIVLLIKLVGGAITILKNMSSSLGRIILYIMENKKCLKPPTSKDRDLPARELLTFTKGQMDSNGLCIRMFVHMHIISNNYRT